MTLVAALRTGSVTRHHVMPFTKYAKKKQNVQTFLSGGLYFDIMSKQLLKVQLYHGQLC